jgi:hypothetical protein
MPKRAYVGYIQLQFVHSWLDLTKPVQFICIQIMPSQCVHGLRILVEYN